MTWSHGPVVTRRRLGGELKRLRDAAGKKLEDVAKALECSPSKISRLETGKGIPRTRDVRDMLEVYGVPPGELRERLLGWAEEGRAKMWWQNYADVLPPAMGTYVELEWDAVRLKAYEPHIVHGLFQTEAYARAVLRNAFGDRFTDAAIERLVEVRMQRQRALSPEHGLQVVCALDESVLYRSVGSVATHRAQVDRLLALAETPGQVEVRILPFSAGLLPSSRDAFAELDFGQAGEKIVYVEQPGMAGEFVDEPTEVAVRASRLDRLHAAALSGNGAAHLMEEARRRIPSV